MLTSKSVYFKDYLYKPVNDDVLLILFKNLISCDYVNFQGNISKGFYPKEVREKILELVADKNKEEKIVLLNDISLHLYNDLTNLGFKNIYLVYGKWNVDSNKKITVSENNASYDIMKLYIESNFKEFDEDDSNIITIKEFLEMKEEFDLIISNPPYSLGNEITKNIIDSVKFKEFINLMPVSKYKKNNIYKHIVSVEVLPIKDQAWDDAMTNPHICTLQKEPLNKSWEEVQVETWDKKWRKYYQEQIKRKESWKTCWLGKPDYVFNLDKNKCFLLTVRTGVDGVHKGTESLDYKFNILKDVLPEEYSYSKNLICSFIQIFNTEIEAVNVKNYWYKSKIMTPIVRGLNKQSLSTAIDFLPKVDWTHPWTDEEILRDYGYTEEEIKDILNN